MNKTFILIIVILIAMGVAFSFRGSISGYMHTSRSPQVATAAQADVTGDPVAKNGKKVLIAYFSWGGNTRKLAFLIHSEIGGDIVEIKPAKAYPDEYKQTTEVAKEEIANNARPEITTKIDDIGQYDVILIGYPIWWGTVPPAVRTFLETNDLTGKVLLPFATSGGGGLGSSIADISASAPKAEVGAAILANTPGSADPWLEKNGLLPLE